MGRLLIEGASVVTLDPKLGDFAEGDILIEDDAIVAVGPDLGVTDAEVIDGRGQIAIPGFANTHLHTWQHSLRGVCADWTVKDYVRCWRIHLGPMYRPEDMYVGNYAGALDALNAGVTLVVDYCHNVVTRDHGREALRGLRDAGVRALFGLAYTPVLDHGFAAAPSFEVENPDLPDHDSRVAFAKQLAGEEFSSKDGLVTLAIIPQEIEIARSWDDVVVEFNSARDLDAQISIHANQSLTGHRWEDVRKLHKADLLGPDILFVHATFSAADELKAIADAGASVSVAPETEMQMGMGFPITAKLIELGVAPSLGVDITSNGSGDMFAQMRLALQVGRMLGDQPYYERNTMPEDVSLTTRQALEWATINGAKGAGLGDVTGTLTPGKQADVVLIDCNHFNLIGWDKSDPVGTVVMQANAGNVGTVTVGGKVVKRDGAMVGVDPKTVQPRIELGF
ncbi:MAG: amidohydrolase family protein [Actinobacteria bacterium]|nr:amidohydrolase family protein [Actinomycetota bacterium]